MNRLPGESLRPYRNLAYLLMAAWVAMVAGSLVWQLTEVRGHVVELARNEARASHDKDIIYRRWITLQGGVYVPVSENVPPNPYLDVPDREVVTQGGRVLTLVNPAYMIRQVHGMTGGRDSIRSHITGPQPLRPENAPDVWEAAALAEFARGTKEVSELVRQREEQVLRLMRPMEVEPGCIKCHASQGYRVGEIAGGISITVPMTPYLARAREMSGHTALVHLVMMGLGLVGIWTAHRAVGRQMGQRAEVERALLDERQRLRNIIEGTQAGTWEWNVATREMVVNERWAGMLGYTLAELQPVDLGTWERLTHPEDLPRAHALLQRHFDGELPIYEMEVRMRRKDGTWAWVLDRGRVIERDLEGRPLLMFGTHTEITARKEQEAALKRTTEELDRYFTSALDLLCIADTDGFFRRLNPEWERALGIPLAQLEGRRFLDLVHPDDLPSTLAVLETLTAQHPVLQFTNRYAHADGTYRWIEWRAFPEGRSIYAVARDVTAQRQALEASERSEKELRTLAEAIPQIVWACDAEGHNVYLNQRWFDYTGLTIDESRGEGWTRAFHPDHAERAWAAWHRAAESDHAYEVEGLLRRADGQYRWFLIRGVGLRDGAGRIVKWLGTCTDIDDLKHAQDSLRLSEEKFAVAFANNPAAIALTRLDDGTYLDVNERLAQLTGYSRAELMGRTRQELSIWPSREAAQRFVTALRERGLVQDLEQEFRSKSGVPFVAQVSAQLLDMRGEKLVLSTLLDITELKRRDAALRASEERLRFALINSQTGGWELDLRDQRATRTLEHDQIFGYDQLLPDWSYSRFLDHVVAEDRGEVDRRFHQALASGSDFKFECRIRRADGSIRWIWAAGGPQLAENGKPSRVAGIVQDITDRKTLENQLRQAQKLESIGQLAGGVAHDFNNILAAMMLNLGLMQARSELSPGVREGLKETIDEAQRAAKLTRQLLMLSRRSVLEIRTLDLNEVVSNLLRMLERLIGEHIRVVFQRAPDLPGVDADASLMEQVLLNLCVNARDSMPRGGTLTIRLETVALDAAAAQNRPGARAGRFVGLAVIDTGVGMTEAVQQRLFEPFFTTKELGRGTGLGLATVHGIVGQHQGWVEVSSRFGQGSTFRVLLPATDRHIEGVQAKVNRTMSRGDETILLVEDEIALRAALARGFRLLGYRVLEAGSGPECLAQWERHGGDVDLLFTDMLMPGGMTGGELAERLLEQKPGLRVIVSSGYNNEQVDSSLKASGAITFLSKPYQLDSLSAAIRQVLDQRPR